MTDRHFEIRPGSLDTPAVQALIFHHFTSARAATDDASGHALDVEGLKAESIRFWSVWCDGGLVGIGALQTLSPDHGEVKSMHTVEHARRTGVADTLLRHILDHARGNGFKRLSLETGSMELFAPARALYRKHGFVECGPFADYTLDPNSTYMTCDVSGADQPCA